MCIIWFVKMFNHKIKFFRLNFIRQLNLKGLLETNNAYGQSEI